MSTAYHLHTDNQTGRTNRTLKQILCDYINIKQSGWDRWLASTEFAINNTPSTSTKDTPFTWTSVRTRSRHWIPSAPPPPLAPPTTLWLALAALSAPL